MKMSCLRIDAPRFNDRLSIVRNRFNVRLCRHRHWKSGNLVKDQKHKGKNMKKHNIGKIAGLVAVVGMGMGASTSAWGALVDLANGNSGSINGANFQWVDSQSTGTGVIDPFSQLQK
jgi:hypothetical protein